MNLIPPINMAQKKPKKGRRSSGREKYKSVWNTSNYERCYLF